MQSYRSLMLNFLKICLLLVNMIVMADHSKLLPMSRLYASRTEVNSASSICRPLFSFGSSVHPRVLMLVR